MKVPKLCTIVARVVPEAWWYEAERRGIGEASANEDCAVMSVMSALRYGRSVHVHVSLLLSAFF